MDPCPFVRVSVSDLALQLPSTAKPTHAGVHPCATPFFCKLRLTAPRQHHPTKTAPVPFLPPGTAYPTTATTPPSHPQPPPTTFVLSPVDLQSASAYKLNVDIFTGSTGSTCGLSSGKLLGKVTIPLESRAVTRPYVAQSGWVSLGKKKNKGQKSLHITVRFEPDPRYLFEFGGEPEESPRVFQVKGSMKQPVFTIEFTNRTAGSKDRKGWSVVVHDLSGSKVAIASMVTPFVASPGSDRVRRSNPGSWLLLKPALGAWEPSGRLEAWRERGDGVGYRFGLGGSAALAEGSLSCRRGGRFEMEAEGAGGFVMAAEVNGGGRVTGPKVEIGVGSVGCVEDAAALVALAAAVDLSVAACKVFPSKSRS